MLIATHNAQDSYTPPETLFPDMINAPDIAEARRLQAAQCFLEHEKLTVLDNIIGLDGTNTPVIDNCTFCSEEELLKKRRSRPNNRRDVSFAEVIEVDGIQYDVLNAEGQGIYADKFTNMVRQLTTAVKLWKRVMCFRLDLHTQLKSIGGNDVRRFIKSLNRRLKTKYKGFKCVGFCWACEVGIESKRRHYHLVIMVDGNLVQGCSAVAAVAKEAWEQYAGQTAYIPENPYIYIERTSHPSHLDQLKEIAKRMSYLAKVKDKGFIQKGKKEFSCSKLKAA